MEDVETQPKTVIKQTPSLCPLHMLRESLSNQGGLRKWMMISGQRQPHVPKLCPDAASHKRALGRS